MRLKELREKKVVRDMKKQEMMKFDRSMEGVDVRFEQMDITGKTDVNES